MNPDNRHYAEFKLSDLFYVKYGVNLELNACVECGKNDKDAVNFVARTAENNGVSAYVKQIDDIVPQKAGLISVAGGGSVLSTFLQNEPFYSGRDLYTLEAKNDISDEAKLFVITIIEQNKYKYSYGRQANKTLSDLVLKLPVNSSGNPDWQFMEDYIKSLHHMPLTTKNKAGQAPKLNVQNWKDFKVGDLFEFVGIAKSCDIGNLDEGDIKFIGRTADDNGLQGYVDSDVITKGNCITASMVGTYVALWQPDDFVASQNLAVIRDSHFNLHNAMFVCSVLNNEFAVRFSYGRTLTKTCLCDIDIKLPADSSGNPDWQFMEDYIKVLPYGDRLEG